MNRALCVAAFLLGLVAVAWVGFGYVATNPLALTMTALIGAFYGMGALELRRFHQATRSLGRALLAIPENLPHLGGWLAQVGPSLQNPVRLRIEGERVGLPGPALTPYLVGLLVLLGMLGTFLGMVVTLNGAVMALESTTDLQTIRAALSVPIRGLGLAFGTSVAGVAASAMLGLLSALVRRERLQAVQLLDSKLATELHGFTLAHQRQETLKTLQFQARLMPEVAEKLQALMAQMALQSQASNDQFLASQHSFQLGARAAYSELAASVGQSLKDSLTDAARMAGATMVPIAEATLTGIARETSLMHKKMADTVQLQLDGLSVRFGSTVTTVADAWTRALARHEHSNEGLSTGLRNTLQRFGDTFEQRSAALLGSVEKTHGVLQADLAATDQQRQAALAQSLEAMAGSLQQAWQQAGAAALGQQAQICKTLEQTARDMHAQAQTHARNTLSEMTGLMQTAAEAPRAAAEMMVLLRQKLSEGMARDNDLLEERSRIMGTLSALLDAVNHAATEQRGAIASMVASSADLMHRVGTQFTEKVETESAKLSAVAAQITGSAVEVSSLGEAFGFAVQLFSESNESLMTHLQRLEASLSKSTARSDEQLAYYVAQAREIIDLSILSQKQIVEDMQQLSSRPARVAHEVA